MGIFLGYDRPKVDRRMHRYCPCAALLGAVLVLPALAAADIYSFVGPDGTMHFTNVPAGDGRFRLHRKSRGAGHRRTEPSAAAANNSSSIDRFTRFNDTVHQAAALYQIPEELVRAVIKVESDYDPRAVSRAGAQGLMQLMPDTAERMQVKDILDPRENILGGVRYLRVLANMFNGDLGLTLAAYNAGEGAVIRHGGIPPYNETQDYVIKAITYYRRYRDARDPIAASLPTNDSP
jgi:soluble lytic murein transglycosylase-like protein